MAINLPALGQKLVRYRELFQETVDEAAVATSIQAERLHAIERGAIEATGDEILILADHYRCDFKFFISDDRVAPFDETDELYRANGGEFSKFDRRAIQEFLHLCETEAFLVGELGRTALTFEFLPRGTFFKGHGAAAADALRTALGYRDHELPRDIYSEFRRVGLHIFRRRLGNSNISGVFVLHPTAGNCALVNASEDIYRQRFSAAHEMAHAIFDAGGQGERHVCARGRRPPRDPRQPIRVLLFDAAGIPRAFA